MNFEFQNNVWVRYIAFYSDTNSFVIRDYGQSNDEFQKSFEKLKTSPVVNIGLFSTLKDANKALRDYAPTRIN